jgi:(2R)-sulfolactate sulfo-lyase subunit alpha
MAVHGALLHEADDDVAVAIVELSADTEVMVMTIEGQEVGTFAVVEDIPLGHKFATRDIPAGKEVIKYGRSIGKATQAIPRGARAHTQNIKSVRWS